MRAQGALLTAFRVRVATIDGALAKVKYVLEFETKVGKDEDLEPWWFTHEWLDELREDLYEVRVIGRTRERDPTGVHGVGHHQPHPSRFGAGRDSPS